MNEPGQTYKPVKAPMSQRLGMELLPPSAEKTVIRMPVAGNTQVIGILHGGGTAALCETAASVAANQYARQLPGGPWAAVGSDISVSHLRPATEGFVTATAKSLHLGRRSTVHRVTVRDDQGRKVATGTVRNMIVEKR